VNEDREAELRALLQRSLGEVRRVADELERRRRAPLAIVGQACRLPGAPDPARLVERLRSGESALTARPADRAAAFGPGFETVDARGGYLPEVYAFDPLAFGLSPREAAHVDPQQRLCLELAREALVDAGLEPESLFDTRLGVWVAISTIDWGAHLAAALTPETIEAASGLGSAHSAAAGRIAYWLGTRGPAVAVDTACSSGLVALESACDALRGGRVERALVLGVNLILQPHTGRAFQVAGMTSPSGACRSFDARADGYVRGEGGAAVLLEPAQPERPALALLRAVATGQDGRSAGLTAPRGPAQVSVIRAALEQLGWGPDDVDFVEGHGTGTALGDRIEIGALGEVFGQRTRPLPLGSIKAQTGHLEAAAGLAGVLKAVAQLRCGRVFAQCEFGAGLPELGDANLEVRSGATELPALERPWRGGVSSFGFTGTNAHALLEAAPHPRPLDDAPPLPTYTRRYFAIEARPSADPPRGASGAALEHDSIELDVAWFEVAAEEALDAAPDRHVSELHVGAEVDDARGLAAFAERVLELQRAVASARRDTQWCLVTRGACRVSDEQREVDPWGAALWGLVRCLRLEHPDRRWRLIDLEPDADFDVASAPLPPSVELARRDGRWFQPRLEALPPRAAAPAPAGEWWLVGGSGDLGRAVRRALERSVDVRAKSLSRRADTAAGDLALDVSDPLAIEAVVKAGAPPDAWVHLSGHLEDLAFTRLTFDDLERAFAPKGFGARRLRAAWSAQGPPPALIAVASTAAWFGNPGQAAYAAANAHLAACAENWRRAGQRATALVLGPIADTRVADGARAHFERVGLRGLDLDAAARACVDAGRSLRARRGLLAGDLARLAHALPGHPLLDPWRTRPHAGRLHDDDGAPLAGEALRRAFHAAFAEAARDTLQLNADEWSADAVLLDLGCDSLTAVELVHELHARTGIAADPAVVLDERPWPAIADLVLEARAASERAEARLGDELDALDDEEIERLLAEQRELDG
jgi:acyl transferase domain-containing protein/acyl carrier protein